MKPRAYVYQTYTNMPKTKIIMDPVAEGLNNVGYDVQIRESMQFPRGDENGVDLAATWGDTAKSLDILATRSTFRHLLQVDNSYLNRNRYEGHYGLSYGGQRQCQEYLWNVPRYPERFAALNETIKPWRTEGSEIIILAPALKQAKILGFAADAWAARVHDQLQRFTKKRIIIRIKRYGTDTPLREVLRSQPIFAAVGYNTKGLVECLLEGVPIFTLGPCAAQSLALHDLSKIEYPYYPESRLEFFERLAGTQWLLSEIAEGLPFIEWQKHSYI